MNQGVLAARSGTEFTWSPQLSPSQEIWPSETEYQFSFKTEHGRECRPVEGRWLFLLGLSFPVSKHQEKVFMNFFNGIFGHQVAWSLNRSFMGDLSYRDSTSRQGQLFLTFVNFRVTNLLHLLYFSTYSGIKTLFLILNICYEHTILVWVLQQSYVNVH